VNPEKQESGGDDPGSDDPGGDEPNGAELGGDDPGSDDPGGAELGGDEPNDDEPGQGRTRRRRLPITLVCSMSELSPHGENPVKRKPSVFGSCF